mmetsp:Transcript_61327/g.181332  ORF Transcript_61327/g.181332 Transcript_61327/m.181332 type:complete len:83 (-) Transcript_61327:231-479(-)
MRTVTVVSSPSQLVATSSPLPPSNASETDTDGMVLPSAAPFKRDCEWKDLNADSFTGQARGQWLGEERDLKWYLGLNVLGWK